jgi:hypothetical protein
MSGKAMIKPLLSRRECLARLGRITPALVFGAPRTMSLAAEPQGAPVTTTPTVGEGPLSPEDDLFLDELERAEFSFFWEQASPQTGLVKDRCNVRENDHSVVASIAATGFGLTALCIGEQRGWVSTFQARERVLTTLRFLWSKLPNHRGFFFHFADINTGARLLDSEVSSVDTTILLCGVLTCRQHFLTTEIRQLAVDILNRVEWTWLAEDTSLLSMGWMPEIGFLPSRWQNYSELMMMYLLGMGSSASRLNADTWSAWRRIIFDYDGMRYIGSFAPLFVHQYSQAWFDFRNKRDAYANYFQNSTIATQAHRQFCIELGKQFPDYSRDFWGITASDSRYGYVVWGGPPSIGPIDGTLVPSAAGGSLPFLPQETTDVLRNIRARYGRDTWTKYGFVDAFNPLDRWYDPDVVGIDTGITLVMAENLRSGFVWNTFMRNPEARRGMDLAGFKPTPPS